MRLLALGLLHQCVAKTCPDGWSIGINSYGAPDPMNMDRCYPTADMAKVASCVGQDGTIKVDVHIKKELGDKPDGFTDLDDDTWSRVFEVSEMGKSGTDDHLYLMRNIHIPGKSVIYRGLRIQKTVAVNLMFLCQYSLKERDVREDFTVTGQDALESRKSTGALKYRLKVLDDDMLIGDQINFEVIPSNPDVVYALVTRCYVVRGLHQLTIFGEDGNFCYNPYVGFEIVSGFNSQSVQHFRYNAFKWSVDKAETTPENQGLLCRIKLKSTAFEKVEPHVCDQNQPLMETIDENKSNKGQGAQDRQMVHDFTGYNEEEEEEEEEEIELGTGSLRYTNR